MKSSLFFLFQKKSPIITWLWIFRTKKGLENLWCLYNERREIRLLIRWVTSYPFQIPWFGTSSLKERIHYEVKAVLEIILLNYGKKFTIELLVVKNWNNVCMCVCASVHGLHIYPFCTDGCKNKHRWEAESTLWILFPESKSNFMWLYSFNEDKWSLFRKMNIIIACLLHTSNWIAL